MLLLLFVCFLPKLKAFLFGIEMLWYFQVNSKRTLPYIYMYPFSLNPLPSRLPHNIEQSSLCYAVSPCQLSILLLFLNVYLLFIWLHQILVTACGIFSCGTWDLVPWPGIEYGPPEWTVQSLSHWTIKKVPWLSILNIAVCTYQS